MPIPTLKELEKMNDEDRDWWEYELDMDELFYHDENETPVSVIYEPYYTLCKDNPQDDILHKIKGKGEYIWVTKPSKPKNIQVKSNTIQVKDVNGIVYVLTSPFQILNNGFPLQKYSIMLPPQPIEVARLLYQSTRPLFIHAGILKSINKAHEEIKAFNYALYSNYIDDVVVKEIKGGLLYRAISYTQTPDTTNVITILIHKDKDYFEVLKWKQYATNKISKRLRNEIYFDGELRKQWWLYKD